MPKSARRQYRVIHEKDVPMKTRDGVTLYSDVFRPDAADRFPVLVSRTPYSKENFTESNVFFASNGYVTLMQDVRGRYRSEGEYYPLVNDINDGYDTVEWAASLPWSNGRVGTIGQSYLAATQYMLACHNPMPPHLQAMAPISASADYHQSWLYHTGGAMMLGWAIPYAIFKGRNTLERLGRKDLLEKMDAYVEEQINFGNPLRKESSELLPLNQWSEILKETAPYFEDYFEHPDDGEYWWKINVVRHKENVRVPMLHVSSWYDIFLEGAINAYASIRDGSAFSQARRGQRLLLGPWGHLFPYTVPNSGGTGDIDFGPRALIDLHEHQLRWFDYWLKDMGPGLMDDPPVTVFVMGENRWKGLEDWPPPSVHYVPYYLHSSGSANTVEGDGTLSTTPPLDEPADVFIYDPSDPVPTLGGNNLGIGLGVQDQRPVENREDVLVFTSDLLEAPIEVTGPITVNLWASSTAPDTDFTAKLIDVHPDGYACNLQDGIIRARYRVSRTSPTLIEPRRVYQYAIDLWATSNVFLIGHRIRLEISSSNFPRFDRNPNTGADFATDSKVEVAQQTIYHRAGSGSHILLPILPR